METPSKARPIAKHGAFFLLVVVVATSLFFLMTMIKTRVNSGESYPLYSSLRADPLGSRALYEAVDRLPNVTTSRNFKLLPKVSAKPSETYVFMGFDCFAFNADDEPVMQAIPRLAAEGARVIIALDSAPNQGRISRILERVENELTADEEAEKKKAKSDAKVKAKAKTKDPTPQAEKKEPDPKPETKPEIKRDAKPITPYRTLAEQLKLAVSAIPGSARLHDAKNELPAVALPSSPLKSVKLPGWHSINELSDELQDWAKLRIDLLSKHSYQLREALDKEQDEAKKEALPAPAEPSPWTVHVHVLGKPAVMERRTGAGSVVVCTDRYFLSNEALWKHPHSGFLSWLIGSSQTVIFDETHLGSSIGDDEGIMTLARRYGMHGLIIGGFLLFALFVWRSTTSLVPYDPDLDLGHWREDAVAGQSAAAGLEGMLRRGIPISTLLARCFKTWSHTKAATATVAPERIQRATTELERPEKRSLRQFPELYRKLRDTLHPPRPS
jgi:hypothetical protein